MLFVYYSKLEKGQWFVLRKGNSATGLSKTDLYANHLLFLGKITLSIQFENSKQSSLLHIITTGNAEK
jgi:hypothetical protein